MALDLSDWIEFLQENLPTALVVGFAASSATWIASEKMQEKKIDFLNLQITSLRQDTTNIEQLKAKVKELESRVELFEEQQRRKDDMLPTVARFDPKQFYTPSSNVKFQESKNAN
jgi:Tfp pilus assembly protein PilN